MPLFEPYHDSTAGPPGERGWFARLALAAAGLPRTLSGAGDGAGPDDAPDARRHARPRREIGRGAGASGAAPAPVAAVLTRWRHAERQLRDPERSPAAERAHARLALDVAVPYLRCHETLPALLRHYLEDRWRPPTADAPARPASGTVEYWVEVACQSFPAGATGRQRELVEHAAFWRRFRQLIAAQPDPPRAVHPPHPGRGHADPPAA